MANNNEIMVTMDTFQLPDMTSGLGFSADDLAEDMEGLRPSFGKVKIPGGGVLQFELPSDDPENPDYAKTLEGVLLYNHASNAYWQEGSEYDENSIPLCSSVNGICGIGNPGGVCEECVLNQYNTAPDGKGKACKNMRVLYLLRDGEFMPLHLSLPPTSLRPFNDFYNTAFASRRRATYGSVIQIGLKRVENGPNLYSVATFKKLFDFTGEKLAEAIQCANGFREQIKLYNQQRAANNEDRQDEEISSDEHYVMHDDGDSFSINNVIDGDRDDLPA